MNRKQRRQATSGKGGSVGILAPGVAETRLAEGRGLMRAGRLADATAIARQVLKAAPKDGYALHLLGTIAGRGNKLDEAARHLIRAAELLPNEPVVHLDLGTALHGLGRSAEAVEAYGRAARLSPNLVSAHMGLGNALKAQRRFEEALAAYRRVVELAPGSADGFANLGEVLKGLDKAEEAIAAYQMAIERNPRLADVHNALGILLWRDGQLANALASLRRALQIKPDWVEVHQIIGRLLLEDERAHEAEAPFRVVLRSMPDDGAALEGLADALEIQGRLAEAKEILRRALVLDPDRLSLHRKLIDVLGQEDKMDEAHAACGAAIAAGVDPVGIFSIRANLYVQQGLPEKAREVAEMAQQADPSKLAGLMILAKLQKLVPGDDVFERLKAAAAKDTLLDAAATSLDFTLSKAYQDSGDNELAFAHLDSGNRRHRNSIRYSVDSNERSMEKIAAAFDAALIDRLTGNGDPTDVPIFVVGMPRSGTTLTEQILASHPAVHGAGELKDLGIAASLAKAPDGIPLGTAGLGQALTAELCNRIGTAYRELVVARDPTAARVTDKMPFNYLKLGLIHLALPNAKIVHCVRDPVDTCLSCYQQPFKSGNRFSYDLAELGRYYRAYAKLMSHWKSVLPAGRVLEMRYEDVVADIESQARRLVDHCGLPWDDACLSFHKAKRQVRTASVSQVRQPIYSSSVAKWRRYERHLQPLLEALGGLVEPAAASKVLGQRT